MNVSVELLREVTFVEVVEACPFCDGDLDVQTVETEAGDEVTTYTCIDCRESWLVGWADERVPYVHEDSVDGDPGFRYGEDRERNRNDYRYRG